MECGHWSAVRLRPTTARLQRPTPLWSSSRVPTPAVARPATPRSLGPPQARGASPRQGAAACQCECECAWSLGSKLMIDEDRVMRSAKYWASSFDMHGQQTQKAKTKQRRRARMCCIFGVHTAGGSFFQPQSSSGCCGWHRRHTIVAGPRSVAIPRERSHCA